MTNKEQYPYMLIMRAMVGGCIWQAYEVANPFEVELLTKSATANGFVIEREPAGYTTETSPGWRDTNEWKEYVRNQSNTQEASNT